MSTLALALLLGAVLAPSAMAGTVWGIVRWTPHGAAKLSGSTTFYFQRYDGDTGALTGPVSKFKASNRKTKFSTWASSASTSYKSVTRNGFVHYLKPNINCTLCWISWRWQGSGKHRVRDIKSIRGTNFAD